MSVATPETWRGGPMLRSRYDGLVFDRRSRRDASQVLGVGHGLLDRALEEAALSDARVIRCEGLISPLLILTIENQVTGDAVAVHRIVAGLVRERERIRAVIDWKLLDRLNGLKPADGAGATPWEAEAVEALWERREEALKLCAGEFSHPHAARALAILPASES